MIHVCHPEPPVRAAAVPTWVIENITARCAAVHDMIAFQCGDRESYDPNAWMLVPWPWWRVPTLHEQLGNPAREAPRVFN